MTGAPRALRCFTSALLFTICVPLGVQSQLLLTVDGRVTAAGQPVEGAAVTLRDVAGSSTRMLVSRADGTFRVLGVDPGRYELAVAAPGFAAQSRIEDLVIGQAIHIAFELQPSAVELAAIDAEAVRVPSIEIVRSSVSAPVLSSEIRNLPLMTRSVTDLAGLSPGIRSYRPLGGQSLPSAGALRGERFLNFYLDGMPLKNFYDGNLIGFPQFASPLPADAIREFRVYLHPYDPAYGSGATYVLSAVTQRGSNELTGSAFGFLQHRRFSAGNDFLRARPNFAAADFGRLQSGVSVRGPIVKDRLHFAGSYEASSTRNHVTVVPRRPAFDPGIWDAHAGVFEAPTTNHTGVLRISFTSAPGHTIEAISSLRLLRSETRFGGLVSRAGAIRDEHFVRTLNLRHHWLMGSRVGNESSVHVIGWNNEGSALQPQPFREYPGIRIGAPSPRFEIAERHVRISNRFVITIEDWLGSHVLSAGMEATRVTLENFFPNLELGHFAFRTDTSSQPASAAIAVGRRDPESNRDAATRLNGWQLALHVAHEWRLAPGLALNLGLRYDVEDGMLNNDLAVPWRDDPELMAMPELERHLRRSGRRPAAAMVSPRASMLWSPRQDGSLSLRAGAGVVHDRVPGFIALQEQRDAVWSTHVFDRPGTTDPLELRRRVREGTQTPASFSLIAAGMRMPRSVQWSAGAGRKITPRMALNVDYIQQTVRNLYAETNLNWLDVSGSEPRRALTSRYGDIILWDDFAAARYRALLTQLTWHPAAAARINVAYTLGSAAADWDATNQAVPGATAARYYVLQRISGDERHRLVVSGYGPLVWGLTGSVVATAASPRPYPALLGVDANQNNFAADDWIGEYRFLTPPSQWRNWYRVLDVRLSRTLPIRGSAGASVIAEVFNLLNSENYSSFDGRQLTPAGDENAAFRRPTGVFAPRQLQLGLRLDF